MKNVLDKAAKNKVLLLASGGVDSTPCVLAFHSNKCYIYQATGKGTTQMKRAG